MFEYDHNTILNKLDSELRKCEYARILYADQTTGQIEHSAMVEMRQLIRIHTAPGELQIVYRQSRIDNAFHDIKNGSLFIVPPNHRISTSMIPMGPEESSLFLGVPFGINALKKENKIKVRTRTIALGQYDNKKFFDLIDTSQYTILIDPVKDY